MLPKKFIEYLARLLCVPFALGLIYVIAGALINFLGQNTPIPPIVIGSYKVPQNHFGIGACIFSLFMLGKIYQWITDYSKTIKTFSLLLVLCFFGAETLTVSMVFLAPFWPLLVALLLIVIMTMNASFRVAVIEDKSCDCRDITILLKPIFICLITAAAISCLLYYFIKTKDIRCYLSAFPPLLVLVPRYMMRSNKMRIDGLGQASREIGYYIWFTVFTVLTFIATATQVSFILVFNLVGKGGTEKFDVRWFNECGDFLQEACVYDIMFLYVCFGIMGFIGYNIFPKPNRDFCNNESANT